MRDPVATPMGEALRRRRHGTGRGPDQSGYITRDMRAAQRFFRSARSVAGFVPDRVTTDGHNSYRRAIRSTLETLRRIGASDKPTARPRRSRHLPHR